MTFSELISVLTPLIAAISPIIVALINKSSTQGKSLKMSFLWGFSILVGIVLFLLYQNIIDSKDKISEMEWTQVKNSSEKFNPDCMYRIKITNGKAQYTDAVIYPTIISPDEMHGAWLKDDYWTITLKNNIYSFYENDTFGKKNYSFRIERICP